MSVENWLAKLETEAAAMKQGYQRPANTIPVLQNSLTHSTVKNTLIFYSPSGDNVFNSPERIIVTFATTSGTKTLATLELTSNSSFKPKVRRIPYTGGARWIVTAPAKGQGTSWEATEYNFTVESMIDGTLSAVRATS